MDNAVALVRAYLHVNGYFTVTEYPILEAARAGGYRTATDLDVLAFRFPGAGRLVAGPREAGTNEPHHFEPDPELEVPARHSDMIIGEVKEGRAELIESALRPEVLEAALARFGCCHEEQAPLVAQDLLHLGTATVHPGHEIRLVVFAARGERVGHPDVRVISLGHVVRFLQEHLHEHWDVLRHAQVKGPAFGFLMTLRKALGSFDSADSDEAYRGVDASSTPRPVR